MELPEKDREEVAKILAELPYVSGREKPQTVDEGIVHCMAWLLVEGVMDFSFDVDSDTQESTLICGAYDATVQHRSNGDVTMLVLLAAVIDDVGRTENN